MAITASSSVLGSTANNIVKINLRAESSIARLRREFDTFGRFLEIKTLEIERVELPSAKEIKKLSTINVVNTFGSAGGLLSSLASGALDLGGFITDFFSGRNNKMGKRRSGSSAKPKPTLKGSKLKIPGMRAAPIIGTIFAGLDFATGLAEGESVGKSAAGTAGSLAGSMLGGVIGQTLIPVPGLGFVIGSAVGGFLGGWGADRAYDAGASLMSKAQKFQEEKLRESKQKEGKAVVSPESVAKQNRLINTFDDSVSKFSNFVDDIYDGRITLFETEYSQGQQEHQRQMEDTNSDLGPSMREGETIQEQGLDEPGGFIQGGSGLGSESGYAVHFHLSPPTISESGFAEAREVAFIAAKRMFARGSIIYFGNSREYAINDDNKLREQIKREQSAHTQPGRTQGGIDMNEVQKSGGMNVKFPLKVTNLVDDIRGGYGREARIIGTNVLIAHGAKGSENSIDNSMARAQRIRSGMESSDLKPGQSVQTQFGRQSSTQTRMFNEAPVKSNFKGYLIVPGHITGDGDPGEPAAVEKIAQRIVSVLKSKYPGVPIELWNDRSYGQSKTEYTRQMNDLKKKENEGWEVIEIHLDAPGGAGRGVIVPNIINAFEAAFAREKGAYPQGFRNPLATTSRGMSMVEVLNNADALRRLDPAAIDYASRDVVEIFDKLVREGKFPNYRPPSRVSPPPPSSTQSNRISYTPSYNRAGSNTTFVAMNIPQPSASPAMASQLSQPSPVASSSGGAVILGSQSTDSRRIIEDIRLYRQTVA